MSKTLPEVIRLEKRLKKILLGFLICLGLVFTLLFFMFYPLIKEDYCMRKVANEHLSGPVGPAVIECERETKLLFLF